MFINHNSFAWQNIVSNKVRLFNLGIYSLYVGERVDPLHKKLCFKFKFALLRPLLASFKVEFTLPEDGCKSISTKTSNTSLEF